MAWIESHQTLLKHKKTNRALTRLSVDRYKLIGHLHVLWWWALDNIDASGVLNDLSYAEIAMAAEWDGDANQFVEALIFAGFIDQDDEGSLTLHDWWDYAGKLLDRRATDRRRKLGKRQHAETERIPLEIPRNSAGNPTESVGNPSATVPYLKDQKDLVPNEPEPNAKEFEPDPEQEGEENTEAPELQPSSPKSLRTKHPVTQEIRDLTEKLRERVFGERKLAPNWRSKNVQCLARLADQWGLDDIKACANWMWQEPFWRDQFDSWMTLERAYAKWLLATKATGPPRSATLPGIRPSEDHTFDDLLGIAAEGGVP